MIGEELNGDLPLCMVHAATEADADLATARIQAAYHLAEAAPADPPLIYERIA